MSDLIGGLPDDVALRCLAYIPYHLHPQLELVSRSWRSALKSSDLFKVRQEVGSTEELLCVSAFEPENQWQLYDPLNDLWITIPVLPSKIRHLSHFGAVSTSGKLFILGGGSDGVDPQTGDHDGNFATNEVWSYDLISRRWSQCASMRVPRSMFACCVLDGKIVVAGGFTSSRKSTAQAEIYDPKIEQWFSIPDLPCTYNSACSGVVIEGKMHVTHNGFTVVQILGGGSSGWRVEDYGWLRCPLNVVDGELYVISHGTIIKQDGDKLKPVGCASLEFRSKIGYGTTWLGREIYVLGGVIGPDSYHGDIKPTSDVEVFPLGFERPIWRRVAPMTRCRGTILGSTQLRI